MVRESKNHRNVDVRYDLVTGNCKLSDGDVLLDVVRKVIILRSIYLKLAILITVEERSDKGFR